MFDGQSMRAACLAATGLLLLPRFVSAEVMDKEPTIEGLWARALACGVIGLLAWRRGPRWGMGALLLSFLFVWGFYSELTDPFVGPDILREAGPGYVSGVYLGFWVCALLHVVGAAAFVHRRRSTNRQRGPVVAS